MTAKEQFEVNKRIEELVASKGDKRESYTLDELALIGLYGGSGGLADQGAKGKGILYEFYTPKEVAEAMWGLILRYLGDLRKDGICLLEPAIGTGNLIANAPPDTYRIDGFEINPVTSVITSLLFPSQAPTKNKPKGLEVNIYNKSFESLFYSDIERYPITSREPEPVYNVVIGNPPYGTPNSMYQGLGEKKRTGNPTNWNDYFIHRSLDLTVSGGIVCLLVGGEQKSGARLFLERPASTDKGNTKIQIAERAELVDAYRLPIKTFERSECGTEIVVFRKR